MLFLLEGLPAHSGMQRLHFAKENAVKLLAFPSHISHKLQPFVRSVPGPFDKFVKIDCKI